MSERLSFEIRRRLPAEAPDVFRWWTEPDLMASWMSPEGSVEAQVDLRVGGAFRIVMRDDDDFSIEHTGEYVEVDGPTRLSFTWLSPYTGGEASLVTVELTPTADGETDLRLVHGALPRDTAASHAGGWGQMLDRLTAVLGGARADEG